jgi:UDP-N-acetylenolpyruvoylglucosamine reductase
VPEERDVDERLATIARELGNDPTADPEGRGSRFPHPGGHVALWAIPDVGLDGFRLGGRVVYRREDVNGWVMERGT